jgi:putative Flp pilus-assembly TadE/G-like protein
MRRPRFESESGAVIVMFAVWLPVLAIFVSFTVDFAHFFDYSRNLQNRADAAARAAAVAYGNTCFGSGWQSSATSTNVIGNIAQQYAGPPNGTPSPGGTPPGTNLPFKFNSTPTTPYQNQPNLTKGTPANFHMLLNSTQSWPNGTNWSMGTAASGSNPAFNTDSRALCSSRDEDGNVGPMVDVRLTQAALGLFFPSIFGVFTPNINAHARAALEGEASTNSAPIAVGDTGFTPCVSVNLVNAATNTVLQTVTLTKEPADPQDPTAPAQWDNSGSPFSFTMPASANVYVQPYLNDCNGTGQTYDDSSNTGLLMINNHPSSDPTVATGSAPQLNSAGVTATSTGACSPGGGNVNGTQYFSVGGCTVTVSAGVTFASGIPNGQRNVYLLERTWDNTNNVWVTTTPSSQNKMNSGGQCSANSFCGSTTIADSSGIDEFVIGWSQTSGSINGTSCSGNPTPAACQGDFGIQAQSFGACNGCDQPDESGPVIFSRISEVNNTTCALPFPCNDMNSFAGGSTHNLIFTFKLSGLNTAAAGSPPTILRFSAASNHQTGLVDCGQGQSGSNDSAVVYYGCGPDNPLVPGMNPLFVYSRPPGSGCSPATDGNTTGWPNGNNQDCVQTTPGQRRTLVICPLVERIVSAPFGGNCTGGASGTCPTNHWTTQDWKVGDPRAVQMVITSVADFASAAGSPQAWVPIRKFATFYVTGWDQNIKPQCGDNEPFPFKGKQNSDNGAVWGHWIDYEDTSGTPNGQSCVPSNSPTNCVPALTR